MTGGHYISVKYRSSNENVLKVDPDTGEVTIVDVGNGGAVITATVLDEYVKYYESPIANYTVIIERAEPEYEIPTDVTGILGQSLSDVKLPDGWGWRDNGYLNYIGEFTYLAGYVPKDTARYKEVRVNLTVTVVGADTTELERLIDDGLNLYNGMPDLDYYYLIQDSTDLQKKRETLIGTITHYNSCLNNALKIDQVNAYVNTLSNCINETNQLITTLRDSLTFVVYFYGRNSHGYFTKKVNYGKPVESIEEISEPGYIFKGWFTDEALTIPFDFSTPITKSIAVYSKWEKDESTNPDPGTVVDPSNQKNNQGSYTLDLTKGKNNLKGIPSQAIAITLIYITALEEKAKWDERFAKFNSKIDLDCDGNYDIEITGSDVKDITYVVLPTNSIEYDITYTFSKNSLETIENDNPGPYYEKLVIVFKERPAITDNQNADQSQAQTVNDNDKVNTESTDRAEAKENIDKKQKTTKVSKLDAGKKSITVTWKKQAAKGIKGYEIQYSTDKNFKNNVKTVTIKKTKTTSTKIKKLKSKKKYYVRIRTYKKSGAAKVYSNWSKTKSVKVK